MEDSVMPRNTTAGVLMLLTLLLFPKSMLSIIRPKKPIGSSVENAVIPSWLVVKPTFLNLTALATVRNTCTVGNAKATPVI